MFAPLNHANATNGQLPTCVGTYKCGMGGAGLTIASDPTAAAINPALAARMGNSAIINAGWFHADVERQISGTAGANTLGGKQKSDASDFANGSLGVNYVLENNMAINVSIYPGGGGATDWDHARTANFANSGDDRFIRWRMFNLQAALGYAPNETSSYGFGVVLSRADMKTNSPDNQFGIEARNMELDVAYGAGFQIGGVWDIGDKATIAADYHSKVWHERFAKYTSVFNSTVDRPATFSIGADVRVTPATTVALDVKQIMNGQVDTISTDPSTFGGFGWEDVTVFMLGVQHDVNDDFQVRAGYNYGKSPIDSEHVFANVLFPAIVEHHFTAGLNYAVTDTIDLGLSGYVTPTSEITEHGSGNGFSVMGSGTKLWHRQYGSQVSVKYNF